MIRLIHYGERSFSYAAPVEWNNLDVEIYHSLNIQEKSSNLFIQYCIKKLVRFACILSTITVTHVLKVF